MGPAAVLGAVVIVDSGQTLFLPTESGRSFSGRIVEWWWGESQRFPIEGERLTSDAVSRESIYGDHGR